MTDPNRIPLLEAQLERTALERDEARQVLAEIGKENARLRAALNLHREALADHRREFSVLVGHIRCLCAPGPWDTAGSTHVRCRYCQNTKALDDFTPYVHSDSCAWHLAIKHISGPALSEEEGTPDRCPACEHYDGAHSPLCPSPATPSEAKVSIFDAVCEHGAPVSHGGGCGMTCPVNGHRDYKASATPRGDR